jgi:hypothetical protein
MRRIFTTLFLIFVACSGFAQTFSVDTLHKSGALSNRINIVILGDGFTQAELPKFTDEARKFADFFLSYAPYNRYRNYFNFFSISTPSRESGVTNPGTAPDAYKDQPVGKKDTYFKATFGTSIHRLVTIDYGIAFNVLAANLPEYDLAVILVNTEFYGGSGGSMAVHTLDKQANLIGMHEIGHTFSFLNDEYWAGPGYGFEAPNMSANNNAGTIKWRNWLNWDGIGIYKLGTDAEASKWHKPANGKCLMEYLNQQFCAVCAEATTERILAIVNPIEKVEPDAEGVIRLDKQRTFRLSLIAPQPNSLQVEWVLNKKPLASGVGHVDISPADFDDYATLTASIFDSTALSRADYSRDQRSWKIEWNLESGVPKVFGLRSSADSLCAGDPVTVNAVGCAGAVSWSTGQTGNSITFNANATTRIEATCKVEGRPDTIVARVITVHPLPAATATNTGPYFVGAAIELSAQGGNTYSWTGPGNFTSNLQVVSIPGASQHHAGIYQVVVKDENGCSATATTDVKVDPILAVGSEPNAWVQVSPNPARGYLRIGTKLSGQSVFTIYDVSGKKLLVNTFERTAEIKLMMPAGMYLYRFTNAQRDATGKILVQ